MMRLLSILASVVVACAPVSVALAGAEDEAPNTIVMNPQRLLLAKQRVQAGDPLLMDDYNGLIGVANNSLTLGPWSVMDKDFIPPSGDKHDFMHFLVYYWPNDWSPDGFPWVYRDGFVNPEALLDLNTFWDMSITTFHLALAYHYSDNEAFAERAAYLIRYWFLDEATYMTPRFEYGNINPGPNGPGEGNASLVTTALLLSYICDSVALLESSPSWTEEDRAGMLQWYQDYLLWLETSPKVEIQRMEDNNHGDHHDVHPALMYLATGDLVRAKEFLETIGPNRIASQIEPDGTLPNELNRADSLTYHLVVLRAFAFLAEMGANNDVDIWNYTTEDGRSLRALVDLLVPYVLGEEEWPYFPGQPFVPQWHTARNVFRRSALGLWDPTYADVRDNIPGDDHWKRVKPAYPLPAPEPADRDGSWEVGFEDVLILLTEWGPCKGVGCDLDGDMMITFGDLVVLLSRWGRIPG